MKWMETVERLAQIAGKGCQREEWAGPFNFAIAELRRVGAHLDSLPAEHRLPLPDAAEITAADRAMLEPEYCSQP